MVRADPGQFRPVVNRQGRGWHWLSAWDIPSVRLTLLDALYPLVGKIRLFGTLLRLVRVGGCRVGHHPSAHGCLAALRALDSRERPTCDKDDFGQLGGPDLLGILVRRTGTSLVAQVKLQASTRE